MNFNDLNRAYETSQERRYQEQAEEEDRREYWDNVNGAIEHLKKASKFLDEIGLPYDLYRLCPLIDELEAMKETKR